MAFDAEIEEAPKWFQGSNSGFQHLVIYSDSTSAITRANHSGAGPGQRPAMNIRAVLSALGVDRTAKIQWVKGHAGTPGNERADMLRRAAAWSKFISLAHLKLQISEKFRAAKDKWHADPDHHGSEEIPPPPPKKSCLDGAKNSLARCATQIPTSHWRSAVYLKRIRRQDDQC
jgi:hypothetical protein